MLPDQIPQQKEVCSVKEIAVYLGISESKVRQLIKRKSIPYAKIDGQFKFYLPTIQDWLREITVQSVAESETGNAHTIANRIWNSSQAK